MKIKRSKRILLDSQVPVYDLTIHDNPCFAVNAGIFSHNTKRWKAGIHVIPAMSELREIYTPRSKTSLILHYDYCWSKNTKIKLLNDKVYTIKELSALYRENELYTYSYDYEKTSKLVPGTIKQVKATRKVEKLYKITLDNGYELELTNDHKLYLASGKVVEVKELQLGSHLLSLYSGRDDWYAGGRYETSNSTNSVPVKNSDNSNLTHCTLFPVISKGAVRPHKGGNKLNEMKENHVVIDIQEIKYNDWVYSIEVKEDFHNYFVVASDNASEMILSKNSQFEVRALAAMCNETNMMEAFSRGVDIHRFVACFIGSTKVRLLNGTEKTMEDLYQEFKNLDFWVYSTNKENQVVPGHAHSIRRSGYVMDLIEVELDDDSLFRCTPEHLWRLHNGDYMPAGSLLPGSSLMSFHPSLDEKGYEHVYFLKDKIKITTARVVRVTHIRLDKPVPVYDLTVDDHCNFAITDKNIHSGVFVHNSRVWKIPEEKITDSQRRFAKAATFSILYGKGIVAFAHDFTKGDLVAAKKLFFDLFSAFPNIQKFIDSMHRRVLATGKVHTIFGDPLFIDVDRIGIPAAKRAAQNYPIQSSASSLAGYAIWILYENVKKLGIQAIPICFTHDSSDWEIEICDLFTFLPLMKSIAIEKLKRDFDIPVDIDWAVGVHQNFMMKLERKEEGVYSFSCPMNTFDETIKRLKTHFPVYYDILGKEEKRESLSDLFVTKRAFSCYLGEPITYYEGELRIIM